MKSEQAQFLDRFKDASPDQLDAIKAIGHPFYNPDFFDSLEVSGATDEYTGWLPKHLSLDSEHGSVLLPGYLKTHSYGEYIFDWSIADAIQRMGAAYYPKWVSQLPFTPIPFPELGSAELALDVGESIAAYLKQEELLTGQLLYLPSAWSAPMAESGAVIRQSIAFNWQHRGYRDFDDYLSVLLRKRAKNIRQERRKVTEAGYQVMRFSGEQITPEIIDRFYPFYRVTYLKRSGHAGYLNKETLQQWLSATAANTVIFFAQADQQDVAASLMMFDQDTLYGRYWGTYQPADLLHFECCYYQGIDFCLEHNLKQFNPGVQGEHKVMRGFEPTMVESAYWYSMPGLKTSVEHAFNDEKRQLADYLDYLKTRLPFKPSNN